MNTQKTCPVCSKKLAKYTNTLYWCGNNLDNHQYEIEVWHGRKSRYWGIGDYSISARSRENYLGIMKNNKVIFNSSNFDTEQIDFTCEEDIENFLILQ